MSAWFQRLQPASFDGIPFAVATGDIEGGHRVSTTHVPNARHVNESFGPNARKFSIEAYTVGADCYARAAALLAAAESMHRGLLTLPDSGAHLVRLTKATRKFDKDKLGYAALSIEAVAEPDLAGAGFPADVLAVQAFGAAGAVPAALGLAAGAVLDSIGRPAPVGEAMAHAAADALADLDAMRQTARLAPEGEAAVAPAFAAALAALTQDPASFGTALGAAAIAVGDAADPMGLVHRMGGIAPPEGAAPVMVSSAAALEIAAAGDAGAMLAAAARALALGEALARLDYRDRAQAAEVRAIAVAVFDDALARCGRDSLDLARTLSALRGLTVELIFKRAADLAPLITVSVPARLPALWWSYRLYVDPARAEDVARRAGAAHPSFLPETFEALAS